MASPFRIRVATGTDVPIYQQIIEQVRTAVRLGGLTSGTALPSVRALAEDLLVNPNTVAKAYTELIRDGVLESQAGRGVFVAQPRQVWSDAEGKRLLRSALDRFLHQAIYLGLTKKQIHDEIDERMRELRSQVAKR